MKADQQAAIEAVLAKQTPATAPVKQMVVCPKCEAAGKPNEVVCESSYKYSHSFCMCACDVTSTDRH